MAKEKQVLTERDIIVAWQAGKKTVSVRTGVLITPAARDAAKAKGINLAIGDQPKVAVPEGASLSAVPASPALPVAIGSDHGGYQLKEQLKDYLRSHNIRFEDVGTFSESPVDYPDTAELVANKVAGGSAQLGIIIDGAGAGSAITANKIPGIRAAACYDTYTARNSREHNNANILTLGSRNTGIDIAKEIVQAWLNTGFGGGRHLQRVKKILEIEKKHLRNQ